MLGSLKKKFRPEKGQVVVFTVLLLPLILGVVVFVIELGNIYVHYSDFVNVVDAAADAVNSTKAGTTDDETNAKKIASAKKIANAKKVADANSKNFSNKSDFAIVTYKLDPNPSDENLYIKLEKKVPLIFFKVFGEKEGVSSSKISGNTYKLEAYIISSEEETQVFYKADSLENLEWTPAES